MSDEKFRACLAETLKWEGGWSNHPADPGGPTMKGVIQRVYDAWREKNGKPRRSVRYIDDDEVEAIYRENYWSIVRGDELPPGLDLAVFDFAVNSGPARAARYLQKVLKVKIDGVIGPVTLKAANDADPLETVRALMAERRKFLNQIPYRQYFIKGWMRRCDGIEQACIAMCGLPVKEAPVAPIADADAQSETQAKADHEPKEGPSTATVAAGGAAAGAGGAMVIPSPPEPVVQTIDALSSWQTIIGTGSEIVAFCRDQWVAIVITICVVVGLTLWSRRRA